MRGKGTYRGLSNKETSIVSASGESVQSLCSTTIITFISFLGNSQGARGFEDVQARQLIDGRVWEACRQVKNI